MGRLGKKQIIDKSVYELALERIEKAYELFDTVAVMFSGGKDSTVCLNLTLEVAKALGKEDKTLVHHFDEEAIPFETEHYVRRVSQENGVEFFWWCLPVKHRNACSRSQPYWYPWGPEDKERWVRPLPPEGLTELKGYPKEINKRLTIPEMNGLLFDPLTHGRVGIVMGIRADESLTRTRAVLSGRSREHDFIIQFNEGTAQGNISKVIPIYDWNTQDVWTAPKMFGWDYNTAYDIMDLAGIRPNDQRCAPPYGEEPMRGLYQFKECFPDIWDKMQTRVDGANTAARYSRTELYAYGKMPDKPDDMSWEDFVSFYLKKHPQPYRDMIANRIRDEIQRHYRVTKEPILSEVVHPQSGISWKFILMIAMRGDFKNRKFAPITNDMELRKMKRKYDDARVRESAS